MQTPWFKIIGVKHSMQVTPEADIVQFLHPDPQLMHVLLAVYITKPSGHTDLH
mgnify:CR=1 FL=1